MTNERWAQIQHLTNIERYAAIQELSNEVWSGSITVEQAIEIGSTLFDNQEEIEKFKSLFTKES